MENHRVKKNAKYDIKALLLSVGSCDQLMGEGGWRGCDYCLGVAWIPKSELISDITLLYPNQGCMLKATL